MLSASWASNPSSFPCPLNCHMCICDGSFKLHHVQNLSISISDSVQWSNGWKLDKFGFGYASGTTPFSSSLGSLDSSEISSAPPQSAWKHALNLWSGRLRSGPTFFGDLVGLEIDLVGLESHPISCRKPPHPNWGATLSTGSFNPSLDWRLEGQFRAKDDFDPKNLWLFSVMFILNQVRQ